MRKIVLLSIAVLLLFLYVFLDRSPSVVMQEGERTYLVDRLGERWDITQAVSIGFKAKYFQYGLGRNAFVPLDDRSLDDKNADVPSALRILGVSEGADARAYSIPTLTGHEIANSKVGSKPIAVGY